MPLYHLSQIKGNTKNDFCLSSQFSSCYKRNIFPQIKGVHILIYTHSELELWLPFRKIVQYGWTKCSQKKSLSRFKVLSHHGLSYGSFIFQGSTRVKDKSGAMKAHKVSLFFFKLQNDTKFKNDMFNGIQIPSWRVDLLFGHLLQMKKLRHWGHEVGHRAWAVPTPDFKVSAISSRIMEEMTRT